jgi:hypothetical protein
MSIVNDLAVGFIGAGMMASAIMVRRLLFRQQKLYAPVIGKIQLMIAHLNFY